MINRVSDEAIGIAGSVVVVFAKPTARLPTLLSITLTIALTKFIDRADASWEIEELGHEGAYAEVKGGGSGGCGVTSSLRSEEEDTVTVWYIAGEEI
jgi:hypothetical protein